jgi:hypothetical protein
MQRIEKENKTFENKKERVIESISGASGSLCPATGTTATWEQINPTTTHHCMCLTLNGVSKVWKNSSGVVASSTVTGPFSCQ